MFQLIDSIFWLINCSIPFMNGFNRILLASVCYQLYLCELIVFSLINGIFQLNNGSSGLINGITLLITCGNWGWRPRVRRPQPGPQPSINRIMPLIKISCRPASQPTSPFFDWTFHWRCFFENFNPIYQRNTKELLTGTWTKRKVIDIKNKP